MSTRVQKIRLGIFLLLALLIFLGSIVTLAGLKLWNPRDRYFVRYKDSISGLELGSTVKMKGVRVGQVEKIGISKDVESVVVTLSLESGTTIPSDTRAVMTSIGITGLQFIELTGGTSKTKRLTPNTPQSFITAGTSVIESLTGKASDIAIKTEEFLNNMRLVTGPDNRARFSNLLENSDKLVVALEGVVSANTEKIDRILTNLESSSRSLTKASAQISTLAEQNGAKLSATLDAASAAARGISHATQNLDPQKTLTAITKAANAMETRLEDPNLDKAVASINVTSNRLSALTAELSKMVTQRDRQLGSIMVNLDRASEYLKQFSRTIKERPSLLLRGETIQERNVP